VATVLDAGYRHIDTAFIYGNEVETGRAIAKSGVPREDVFLVTKLWNADQGYDNTLSAFDASLDRLGVDRLDLYLIDRPTPANNTFVDTFEAFAHLRDQGRISSISVSNFEPEHLRILIDATGIVPAVTRSSRIRCCRSGNCAKCMLSSVLPPRRGLRWGKDRC
jgi:2,5-diketo-D-gluconate reductase A